jgi:Ca-activated chloride channel homolog
MTVASPKDTADKLVGAAVGAGGHVESRSEQSGNGSPTVELTLRIPSDKVDGVLADVHKLGNVDSMQVGHDDVTAQRVDLDARIKALQTSVDRLLDLMSKATSTSSLLEAENSLTERQSDLDSLRSQRAALGDQIAYSTITVNLSTEPEVIAPGGFTGAIKDGWEALVKVGGGLAAVIGFVLPWLPVFAVFVGAVWLLRRRQLRRHPAVQAPHPQTVPPAEVETTAEPESSD